LVLLEQPDLGGKSGSEVLSQKLWAVVDYTDAMTRDVAVKDSVFEKLREHFSEQEVVEVTATVGYLSVAFDTRQIVGKYAC
jgi:alkylhydroperoxidase family enzyme